MGALAICCLLVPTYFFALFENLAGESEKPCHSSDESWECAMEEESESLEAVFDTEVETRKRNRVRNRSRDKAEVGHVRWC